MSHPPPPPFLLPGLSAVVVVLLCWMVAISPTCYFCCMMITVGQWEVDGRTVVVVVRINCQGIHLGRTATFVRLLVEAEKEEGGIARQDVGQKFAFSAVLSSSSPPLCPPTHICNYLRFVHLVLCVQPPTPRRRRLLPRGLVFIPEFIYITTRNAAPDEIKHFSANSQKGPSSRVDGPFVLNASLPACWWWIQFPRS